MEIYVKNIFYFHISLFQTEFYQMCWFYPYRNFKHSKWWRHKLSHRILNTNLLHSFSFCSQNLWKI